MKQPVYTVIYSGKRLKEIYFDYQNITKDDINNFSSKKRKLNDGSIQTKKIGDFHHSCNKFNIVEYLWRLRGLLSKSHTGEFLSETIEEIIDEIGSSKFFSNCNRFKNQEQVFYKYSLIDIFHQGGSALKETKACEVPLENSKRENPETNSSQFYGHVHFIDDLFACKRSLSTKRYCIAMWSRFSRKR
ncbi:unnamed protein product [Rhizophagus irregularis]|nr:unnamed protein product [Rhizophagus irregularis]